MLLSKTAIYGVVTCISLVCLFGIIYAIKCYIEFNKIDKPIEIRKLEARGVKDLSRDYGKGKLKKKHCCCLVIYVDLSTLETVKLKEDCNISEIAPGTMYEFMYHEVYNKNGELRYGYYEKMR